MHDYDFYVMLFNYYKEKDVTAAFDGETVAQDRRVFPNLQEVHADTLKKELEKQAEEEERIRQSMKATPMRDSFSMGAPY